MKRLTPFTAIAFSLVLLSGCKVSNPKALKSSEGGGSEKAYDRTRWNPQAFPLDVRISEDFIDEDYSGNDGGVINNLLQAWDAEVGFTFFTNPIVETVNKESTNLSSYRDSELGIYKSSQWFPNVTSNAIAITQWYGINTSDSEGKFTEVIHADIIVNYRDWNFKIDPDPTVNAYYIPQVILHEVGHLLGLNHLSPAFGQDAVMKPYMDYDEQLDELEQTDVDGIVALYQNAALNAGPKMLGAMRAAAEYDESEIVRGVIELMADGECVHKVDDQIVYRHTSSKGAFFLEQVKRQKRPQ